MVVWICLVEEMMKEIIKFSMLLPVTKRNRTYFYPTGFFYVGIGMRMVLDDVVRLYVIVIFVVRALAIGEETN